MQKVRQSLKMVQETPMKLVSCSLINRNTGEVVHYNSRRIPFNQSFYSNYLLYFSEIISHTWKSSDYRVVFDILNLSDSSQEIPLPF